MDMGKLIQTEPADTASLSMHNSVNPIELPEQDAFLGIGHAHLEDGCVKPSRELCKKFGPRYGSRYVSNFFLFDRQAPWSMRKASPAFCVPSMSNSSRCETIQFITSAVLEGDDLLMTYGINDCEAASVRVPLQAVLDFIDIGATSSSEAGL